MRTKPTGFGGVVGKEYATSQNRITIGKIEEETEIQTGSTLKLGKTEYRVTVG